MNDIISLIVSQYLRLRNVDDMGLEASSVEAMGHMKTQNRPRSASTAGEDLGSEGNVDKSISTHNVSQLLLVLADLTSTVPGLATCVHKYHLQTGIQVGSAKAGERSPLTSSVLPLHHSVTGRVLTSEAFVSFLVHNLVLVDVVPTSQSKAGLQANYRKRAIAEAGEDVVSEAKSLVLRRIAGDHLRESAVYLLSALVSIKGDGRRRVLAELVGCLHVHSEMNTYANLKSVMRTVEVLHRLVSPPTWGTRDTFLVPVKDVLLALCQLDAHVALSKMLSTIGMNHPISLEVSLAISACLDIITRKGLPLLEAHLKGLKEGETSGLSNAAGPPASAVKERGVSSTSKSRRSEGGGASSTTVTPRASTMPRGNSGASSSPRSSLIRQNSASSGARSL